jgi:ubiquinone/menaquinone biosynthesis C-methylase UbiE
MSAAQPDAAGNEVVVVADVEAAYDAVAEAYSAAFEGELAGKPLDRALLRAFAELVGAGTICDVGCGPGHITRFLSEQCSDVMGLDLSSAMVAIAREKAPGLTFEVGTMLSLPVADAAWAGVVSLYSIIHLTPAERAAAWREFARVIRPNGWLLLAFHVDSADFPTGSVNHLRSWFGQAVQLDGYFLDSDELAAEVSAAGFTVKARLERQPSADEYPSRRAYFLAQR